MAWTPWKGDKAFQSERPVLVRFRNGKIAGTHAGPTILPAKAWNGIHDGTPDWPFDIVAIRYAE